MGEAAIGFRNYGEGIWWLWPIDQESSSLDCSPRTGVDISGRETLCMDS